MSTREHTDPSDLPEPTSPRARGHREGTPSLAKPLGLTAVVVILVLALVVLIPGLGGAPDDFDPDTQAAPGAAEDTNIVEGQGAEPENSGGVLEPGMLPEIETPIGEPAGPIDEDVDVPPQ